MKLIILQVRDTILTFSIKMQQGWNYFYELITNFRNKEKLFK